MITAFKKYVLLCLCLTGGVLNAQDFGWWNDVAEWDGVTHWSQYIKIRPEFLGPNALPVPEVAESSLSENFQYELRYDEHFHANEKTRNLFTRLYFPIAEGKAAVQVTWLREWYQLDVIARNERLARDFDPNGATMGDITFETKIQLLKDHGRWPDATLNVYLKTASGEDFRNARHTDAPAYHYDLSFGKTYQNQMSEWNWNVMLGLYVWQTYQPDNRQNDAVLNGVSLGYKRGNWKAEQSLAGYIGYQDNGDIPYVSRSSVSRVFGMWESRLTYQHGFSDFEYNTIRVGIIYSVASDK